MQQRLEMAAGKAQALRSLHIGRQRVTRFPRITAACKPHLPEGVRGAQLLAKFHLRVNNQGMGPWANSPYAGAKTRVFSLGRGVGA